MRMHGFGTTLETETGAKTYSEILPPRGGMPRLNFQALVWLFGEEDDNAKLNGVCCDVCIKEGSVQLEDHTNELRVLIDALENVGAKGEVKVAEWIRGSALAWTDKYNKQCHSYGNHCGHDIWFWRNFMKQYHVSSC